MDCTVHRWENIESIGGGLIGYHCVACGRNESVQWRAEEAALRARQQADDGAAIEAKAEREVEVPWTCVGNPDYDRRTGCGVVLRLPRWRAQMRWYCCDACRRRRRAPTAPCAQCARSPNAMPVLVPQQEPTP